MAKRREKFSEIKQHCLTLKKEGKEFEHGNVIPEYIDTMKQSQQQGKSNDEAHLAAGKQVILSLMSGNYHEWKDIYFGQIKSNTERAKILGSFPEPLLTPSQKLVSRLENNYHISKEELETCQMTTQLRKNRSGYHYDKIMELRQKTSSHNKLSQEQSLQTNKYHNKIDSLRGIAPLQKNNQTIKTKILNK